MGKFLGPLGPQEENSVHVFFASVVWKIKRFQLKKRGPQCYFNPFCRCVFFLGEGLWREDIEISGKERLHAGRGAHLCVASSKQGPGVNFPLTLGFCFQNLRAEPNASNPDLATITLISTAS